MKKMITKLLAGFGAVFLLGLSVALAWLMWPTSTPQFVDVSGGVVPGSIAEEEWLMVNGLNQWTLSRGRDHTAPILLVLHGGPGSSEYAFFRAFTSALENHFVVVHWDQRGAGNSFDSSTPADTMNVRQFVLDVDVVVDHLRKKFGRQRVALLGHSWGSALGTIYAAEYPQKVSGYIGTGQLADMQANEAHSYAYTLDEARRRNDLEAIAELQEIGPPPYGFRETLVQRNWLTRFGGGVTHDSRSLGSLVWSALSVSEFNLFDLIAFFRSAQFSMDHLWPQISDFNLDQTYLSFEVPVFFVLGRHDHQTPSVLAAQYFERLTAPHKALFYFEHSAHSPPMEEPDRFVELMAEVIQPRLLMP